MIRVRPLMVLVLLLTVVVFGATACGDVAGVVEQAQATGEAVIEQMEPTAAAVGEAVVEAVEEAAADDAVVEEPSEEGAEAEHEAAPHWSYEEETGPEHWAAINPECGGRRQSPIDVTAPLAEDLEDIIFNYGESAVKIFNNGHTIQVDYDAGSTIELDDVTFALQQFHFHSPSEHTVEEVQADAEMHLVHQADDGSRAVVGVLIFEGAENPAFASVWANLPTEVSSAAQTIEGAFVNGLDLLPEVRTYYAYPGSLTTPPCTENVTWLLLTTPIEMSAEQLAAFREIISGNNRPVQPLNDRELVEDTTGN